MVQSYQGRISLSEKKVREKLLIFCKNISIPDFRSFLADRMRDASDDEGEKESTPTRTSGGRDRDYDTTSSRPSHPDRQPYRPGQMMEAGGGRGGRGVTPFARGLAGTAGGTGASRGGGAQARLMGQRQAPLMRQEPTPASRTAGQSSASIQTS